MGIDATAATFLFMCKSRGVNFSSVLMLGRQWVGSLSVGELSFIAARFHRQMDKREVNEILAAKWAEPFFRKLGAERIDSLDASDFEGANLIHDLNLPIPGSICEQYDVVFDGGTIEHVFNFPEAINNVKKLVKIGGYFLSVSVANNFMGHGFYQFSPELFFRVFDPRTGFKLEGIFLVEMGTRLNWLRVPDPAEIQKRVMLTNSVPTYMLTVARKVAERQDTQFVPQQSDYAEFRWKGLRGDAGRRWVLRKAIYHIRPLIPLRVLSWTARVRAKIAERKALTQFDPFADAYNDKDAAN